MRTAHSRQWEAQWEAQLEANEESSSMRTGKPTETLVHPSLGKLPARKVLECIFALTPDGPYLHHHLEEVDTTQGRGGTVYTLNGQPPASGRQRCQIIPPLVNEFDSFESLT